MSKRVSMRRLITQLLSATSSGLPPRRLVGYPDRMAATTLSLSFPEPDIAVLTIDDAQTSANVLSRHVLEALEHHLNDLDHRKDLAGLVIRSGKPGMFIAGADLKEFVTWLDAPKEEVAASAAAGSSSLGGFAKSQLRHGCGDRWHLRRRRRRTGHVVRSANLYRAATKQRSVFPK